VKLTRRCEGSYFSDGRGDFSHFISDVDQFETSTGEADVLCFNVGAWDIDALD
jgi:hypothetical protein